MPFFSVIVPVYNVEKYLGDCIDSILAQTYQDFELILVNDGSKDSSGAICDAYAEKDQRVQVVHKQNGGVVSARKAGIQKSCGNYIVTVDSDDYIAADYLAHYWDIIQKKQPDIIADNFALVSEEGILIEEFCQITPEGFYSGKDLNEVLQRLLYDFKVMQYNAGSVTWNLWSKAIKRELVLPAQMAVPDIIRNGDDCAVIIPAICKAESLYIANYCGYFYRQVGSSIVHTCNPKEAESIRVLIQHLCANKLPIPRRNVVAFFAAMTWQQTAKTAKFSASPKDFGEFMEKNYGEIISYVADGMKSGSMPWMLKLKMFLIRHKMWHAIFRKYHK